MKKIVFFVLVFACTETFGQTTSFQFLSSAKSSLESIIKNYSSTISDTTLTFKKYYLPLARSYNAAKSSYEGYRGAMKDCILNNNSKRNIQKCLQAKAITINVYLDSLNAILSAAYIENYLLHNSQGAQDPQYTGKNSGVLTGDFIKAIIENLITGTVKIWDQVKKYQKEYKDSYLTQIASKEYELSNFDDLLKPTVKPATIKQN